MDSKELFHTQAAWFAQDSGMTIGRFLDWAVTYLVDLDRDFLKRMLPFLDEDQKEAEKLLCDLLKIDFRTPARVRTVTTSITRQTSWARTLQKAFPSIPSRYHNTAIVKPPDIALIGTMAGLAREWARWLDHIRERCSEPLNRGHQLQERIKHLNKAVSLVKHRGVRPTSLPINSRQRQTIRRHLPPDKYKLFQRCLGRWQRYSSKRITEEYIERIWQLAGKDDENVKNTNLDALFEATSHLSICRSARNAGWNFESTENAVSPPYCLEKPNTTLRLILGKGNPYKLLKEIHSHGERNDNSDRMLGLRRLAVTAGQASGYQPDIVMGFYRDPPVNGDRRLHVVFGDAKRYEHSDIAKAYKETIASTMIAYGHWGKLSIRPEVEWQDAFDCPVNPFFTLFYVRRDGDDPIDPEQYLENDIPPVLAFELQYMQPNGGGQPSPSMTRWFERLEEQIAHEFNA